MGRKKQKVVENVSQYVSEVLAEYKEEKKTLGLSKASLESIDNTFKRFFECFGDEITVDRIDEGLTITFTRMLDNREITVSSINHYLRDYRTFVNWCYKNGYIDKPLVVRMVKGQVTPKKTFTQEELLTLTEKPKGKTDFVEWRDWAIINWIYGTSNRIGTVVNIKIGDLDLKNRLYVIREQKNKSVTTSPLDRKLVTIIKEYMRRCRQDADNDDYLFTNVYGEKLTTKALEQTMAKYNKNRGVTNTAMHNLRHTFAKDFILNGGDTAILQKVMNHKSIAQTRAYINLYGIEIKDAFEDASPLGRLKQKGGSKSGRLKVND